ncbi:hypothetical protein BN946_scf184332.g5 [Trametes cinnabarina]|uniref:Hyaluronan/mRNA-binding protein domain-containing protein n=1 Tax=Pycnoporus cinnabarinus TaxID=5643 RepID=A0A060SP22_PYCCI|nr:hypothetical protein BN946_scf184332.g5 [Trametes cinnabarina]
MTRTVRASYPDALAKDRSEPKNGMDKHIPKDGAGPHNWGRLEDEYELEAAAIEDEQAELEEETGGQVSVNESANRPRAERRGSELTPEEIKEGIAFRKKALKSPDADLTTIARTAPVISTSPTHPTPIVTDADTNTLKTA